MTKIISKYLLLTLYLLAFYACNTTRYVPEGEYLLDKVNIKSDSKEFGTAELRPYIKQVPNYKMFGINKTQLQIYNLSGKDSSKWINKQLRKTGQPPVIFDSTMIERSAKELKKLFVYKGYIDTEVTTSIVAKKKKVEVSYKIQTKDPHLVRNFEFESQDSLIKNTLFQKRNPKLRIPNESASAQTSLIHEGMHFNRKVLNLERDRITAYLRNRGYYAFNKDYISYDADTIISNHAVDLKLKLHLYPAILPNGMFAEIPHKKYFLNKTFIYLNYNPLEYNTIADYVAKDSLILGEYQIYFKDKSPAIRPKALIDNNFLSPGRPYAQIREELTYAAYSSLMALENVSIRFEEFERNDSSFLNTYLLTMQAKRQSTTFALEGTNSSGDLGFASSIDYNHKSIFKGSENFNIKLRGAYEAISSSDNNYLEVGAETALRFPKFMMPFLSSSFKKTIRASTEFAMSSNFQTRPEFDRILFSGSLRYLWQGRGQRSSRHQFNLLDLNYVKIPSIDPAFRDSLPLNARLFSFTDLFIAGASYNYSYSTFNPTQKRRDAHTLRLSLGSAGNLLYGLSSLANAKKDDKGSYELFNVYYAQYVKADLEYSKTVFIDKQNSVAWRIGGGVGIPYGNSKALPFEKRYYSGGANSVRAWKVRSLGPGAYPNTTSSIYDHSGDIKLDLNIEYRSHLFWKLEAASFVDAGNIWTIRNYEQQEEGIFDLKKFYTQIAIGYGLGLRFDFDFFLIRFDTGWKAFNPEKTGRDRWAIIKPNFGENFAWHFAVGYPF